MRILLAILQPLKLSVGVMSPYSAQVEKLGAEIEQLKTRMKDLDVETSTIDGYQGREKDIVIISMVRSNDSLSVGFVAEEARINVAITRAKRLVILIGDSSTICGTEYLFSLVNYIAKNGKRFRIDIIPSGEKSVIDIKEIK